jgi:hypothetical protein
MTIPIKISRRGPAGTSGFSVRKLGHPAAYPVHRGSQLSDADLPGLSADTAESFIFNKIESSATGEGGSQTAALKVLA